MDRQLSLKIANIKGGVIFLLWGKEAQENEKFINKSANQISVF